MTGAECKCGRAMWCPLHRRPVGFSSVVLVVGTPAELDEWAAAWTWARSEWGGAARLWKVSAGVFPFGEDTVFHVGVMVGRLYQSRGAGGSWAEAHEAAKQWRASA